MLLCHESALMLLIFEGQHLANHMIMSMDDIAMLSWKCRTRFSPPYIYIRQYAQFFFTTMLIAASRELVLSICAYAKRCERSI